MISEEEWKGKRRGGEGDGKVVVMGKEEEEEEEEKGPKQGDWRNSIHLPRCNL